MQAGTAGAGGFLLSLSLSKLNKAETQMQNSQSTVSKNGNYTLQKVKFKSQGIELVGNLFIPENLQGKKLPLFRSSDPLLA